MLPIINSLIVTVLSSVPMLFSVKGVGFPLRSRYTNFQVSFSLERSIEKFIGLPFSIISRPVTVASISSLVMFSMFTEL